MISKEQWQEVEEHLKSSYPAVKFRFEGREVYATRTQYDENTRLVTIYIDGEIRGAWMAASSEGFDPIVRYLWRTRTRAVYSSKRIKEFEKAVGKREAKKLMPNLHTKLEFFDPTFASAAALVRKYRKLNGLELVQIGHQVVEQPAEGATVCN